MPPAPAYADLELHLIAEAPFTYRVDVRFRLASAVVDAHLITGEAARVTINQVALNEAALDPDEYGQRLTEMLFADLRLQAAFTKARDQAEGARQNLRVCLRLDMNDAPLHALHWETLRDPDKDERLFTSEHIILSRYIDSADTSPIDLLTPRQLKALVVVAAPTDLTNYGLAPIDVANEVARARTALGPIRPRVLTRDETGKPVTIAALGQALRDGADLLYLVAHGQLHEGQPYLLERVLSPTERRELRVVADVREEIAKFAAALVDAGADVERAGVVQVSRHRRRFRGRPAQTGCHFLGRGLAAELLGELGVSAPVGSEAFVMTCRSRRPTCRQQGAGQGCELVPGCAWRPALPLGSVGSPSPPPGV